MATLVAPEEKLISSAAAAAVAGAGEESFESVLTSYIGISFGVFLALLPRSAGPSFVASLQSRNRILSLKLFQAEEQLKQLRSRRREDSKANARVVDIFAGHRHAWQLEERRLRGMVEASEEEIAGLRDRIREMDRAQADLRAFAEDLQRKLRERDEVLDYIAAAGRPEDAGEFFVRKAEASGDSGEEEFDDDGGGGGDYRGILPELGLEVPAAESCFYERSASGIDDLAMLYREQLDGLGGYFVDPSPATKEWSDGFKGRRDLRLHDSRKFHPHESMHHEKRFVSRREFPWKVDGESTGVSSKLKLLEQELINLEKAEKGDLCSIASFMRKQAKRYQSLIGKVDDLCRRMQDTCEPALGPDFRTQRQTEFLLEALRLQNCAAETRRKLSSLEGEAAAKSCLAGKAGFSARRSLGSIRSTFKGIQRNLEIWLARIMGDLEGILAAADSAPGTRDYFAASRLPLAP